MDITVAKTAGFCFGVKRAVEKVYEQIDVSKKQIYTFGPIIHNEEVVKDLEEKGVKVINEPEDIEKIGDATLIIRSHGVSKEIYDIAGKSGVEIVDATCPFVKRIHDIVNKESKKGNTIVIIGNKSHPEVEGIVGWVNGKSYVVSSEEDVDLIDENLCKKLCIVSQTTLNYNKFNNLVEIISKKGYDINCLNTICNATHERQIEAKQIASNVDAMIVIGGKSSSNTQKLYEICKEQCDNTYYIQTVSDLDLCKLNSIKSIGITAGASTPKKIIEEVHANVRNEF
ncbi:MAG: 4-hydroxy-3-methylbut-2-enyl diphosphate reductase [Lachnospiraceae bacterium]|nr:4-hydroxy-3-methylbut-2-enyl diphosphate reductase [Lachnospiraceae bacterium]